MRKVWLCFLLMAIVSCIACSVPAKNQEGTSQKDQVSTEDFVNDSETKVEIDTTLGAAETKENVEEDIPASEGETQVEIAAYMSCECSWVIDVRDPAQVYQYEDYFVKVRVKTKEKTKYFEEGTIMPYSTYNLEVLEVVAKDDGSIPKNIKVAACGGVVTRQEYINTMDEGTKEKTNADKLTEEELKENVMIYDEAYYELKQGEVYYIFITDLTQIDVFKGYYAMRVVGFDVFVERDGEYYNVLTDRKLELPE